MSFINKKSLALVLASVVACAAQATPPGNNGGGNGGCGQGQQTNGCGGQGGAGGAGGTGVGVGVGIGVAAAQANAAAVAAQRTSVRVRNTAEGGRATATSGSVSSTNQLNAGSSYSQSGGNVLNNEGARVTVEGDKSTYYAPAQERDPVATAYAAPLTASPETCMGSSSAGGQGSALGLSFGTTWVSKPCNLRMYARSLDAMGKRAAAFALLCQDDDVKKAMEAAGETCPAPKSAKIGSSNSAPVAVVGAAAQAGSPADLKLLP